MTSTTDRSARDRGEVTPVVHHGHRWPALAVALLAAVGVWATWRVFVTTRTGQLLEQAALEGAVYGRTELWRVAEPVLDVISVPFLALVVVVAGVVALVRRRGMLALQVALLVVGANLTTQLLKHVVLDRPDLGVGHRLANGLPSGHTTAAASAAAALLLVSPRRARPAVALLGVAYAAATGVSTMVGGWHRPSDVVAGVLVVVAWSALAIGLVPTRVEVPGPDRPASTFLAVAALLVGAAVSGGLAAAALLRSLEHLTDGVALASRADQLTAYGGGALAVVAVTCAGWTAVLWVLRAAETRRLR